MFRKLVVLTFLLTSTICFAADNPTLIGYPENKIMGFRGLDTSSRAPNIEDGRATDLQNVLLSSAFDLKKRYGYSKIIGSLDDYDISSPAVTGIFDSEYSNGSSYTLVFVGNKLKYDNTTSWSTLNVAPYTDMTSGQDYLWKCVMALDNAICTNNYNPVIAVNSTPTKSAFGFTGLSAAPTKVRDLIFFRNYLVVVNTTESATARPTRFRWSDVGSITSWDDDNYYDIASLAGDEIVAVRELYGDLYVIMRKSIWKAALVGGDDIFVFVKMIDNIGAIARDSVQVVNFPDNKLGIVFLSENKHVYVFNGVTVLDAGANIQNTLDSLAASRLQYASAIFDGENYYLSASTSGNSINDTVFVYNTDINEWTKFTQIDANCFARVKESTSVIKTYFGNYKSFVYWLDNTDNVNDIAGAVGVIDSVGTTGITGQATGLQALIDSTMASGTYSGAIVRITSGTAAGEEAIVQYGLPNNTGVVVASSFSTTPDSTSNYSIGDINAYYYSKHYDFADAPRLKAYRGLYFWAAEDSADEVSVSYALDMGSVSGSETKDLAPTSTSLWDSAVWDSAVWGTTGDKFYNTKLKGRGRAIQLRFDQSSIDKDFHLYGFHILADRLDRE